jgi:hypothetical protein
MKHTLKSWLANNAVTADNKTDKILLLETTGSMNLDDILEEMYETNTGLQRETLRHVVELYHRIVKNAVLRGVQVNTRLFYAVAKFLGEKANVMYILETEDRKNGRRDGGQALLRAWRDAQGGRRRPVGWRNPHQQRQNSDEDRR